MAERTADEWYPYEILLPSIREFMALMNPKPRILDLGCGPGYESMRLQREGAEVLGIDFSAENIRVAKERSPECRFEVMDFTELDHRFGMFDGVFACASLIHISPEKIREVIRRIAEILHEGGFFLCTIRDGKGINERMTNLTVDGKNLKRTVYRYTEEQVKEIASGHDLKFLQAGYLEPSLLERGWRSYIFTRKMRV